MLNETLNHALKTQIATLYAATGDIDTVAEIMGNETNAIIASIELIKPATEAFKLMRLAPTYEVQALAKIYDEILETAIDRAGNIFEVVEVVAALKLETIVSPAHLKMVVRNFAELVAEKWVVRGTYSLMAYLRLRPQNPWLKAIEEVGSRQEVQTQAEAKVETKEETPQAA